MPGTDVGIARNGPPVAVPGFGIPTFELAQAAGHVEDDDPLLIGFQLLGNERVRKHAKAAGAERRRRHAAIEPKIAGGRSCAQETCRRSDFHRVGPQSVSD